MGTELNLTDGPVRVTTAAGGVQSITLALDVSKGDQTDLVLHVIGVEGVVTNFTVSIITGMSMESEDGWVTAGSFVSNTVVNTAAKVNFPGLLRYIRWKVTTITGGTAVTFTVRGMLRSN